MGGRRERQEERETGNMRVEDTTKTLGTEKKRFILLHKAPIKAV